MYNWIRSLTSTSTGSNPVISRRDLVRTAAGLSVMGMAGCSNQSGTSNTPSSTLTQNTVTSDSDLRGDYQVFLFMSTFTHEDASFVKPDSGSIYGQDSNGSASAIVVPDSVETPISQSDVFRSNIPVALVVQASSELDFEQMVVNLSVDIPQFAQYGGDPKENGVSALLDREQVTGEEWTSFGTEPYEDSSLVLDFRNPPFTKATVFPFDLTITVEFLDSEDDVIERDEQTYRLTTPSPGAKNARKLIDTTAAIWSQVEDRFSSTPVDVAALSSQLYIASSTDTLDEPLVAGAIVNGISAFKYPLGEESKQREFDGETGRLRAGGPFLIGKLSGEQTDRATSTETTPSDETSTSSPTRTPDLTPVIDGRNFSIEPETATSIALVHKATGEETYQTDRFRVDIDTAPVTDTYKLANITSNPTFAPGDTVMLNKSTLDLNSEFSWTEGSGVIELYYQHDGSWTPVVKSEF